MTSPDPDFDSECSTNSSKHSFYNLCSVNDPERLSVSPDEQPRDRPFLSDSQIPPIHGWSPVHSAQSRRKARSENLSLLYDANISPAEDFMHYAGEALRHIFSPKSIRSSSGRSRYASEGKESVYAAESEEETTTKVLHINDDNKPMLNKKGSNNDSSKKVGMRTRISKSVKQNTGAEHKSSNLEQRRGSLKTPSRVSSTAQVSHKSSQLNKMSLIKKDFSYHAPHAVGSQNDTQPRPRDGLQSQTRRRGSLKDGKKAIRKILDKKRGSKVSLSDVEAVDISHSKTNHDSFDRETSSSHSPETFDSQPQAKEAQKPAQKRSGQITVRGRRFRHMSKEAVTALKEKYTHTTERVPQEKVILSHPPGKPVIGNMGYTQRHNSSNCLLKGHCIKCRVLPDIDIISPSPTLSNQSKSQSSSSPADIIVHSHLSLIPETYKYSSSGTSSSGSISPGSVRCPSSKSNSSVESTSPLPPLVRTPTLRRGNLLPPIMRPECLTPSTESSSGTPSPFEQIDVLPRQTFNFEKRPSIGHVQQAELKNRSLSQEDELDFPFAKLSVGSLPSISDDGSKSPRSGGKSRNLYKNKSSTGERKTSWRSSSERDSFRTEVQSNTRLSNELHDGGSLHINESNLVPYSPSFYSDRSSSSCISPACSFQLDDSADSGHFVKHRERHKDEEQVTSISPSMSTSSSLDVAPPAPDDFYDVPGMKGSESRVQLPDIKSATSNWSSYKKPS